MPPYKDEHDDLLNKIHAILNGMKPKDHETIHRDVSNRKMNDLKSGELYRHYDISGDLDQEKHIDNVDLNPVAKDGGHIDIHVDVNDENGKSIPSFLDYVNKDQSRRNFLRKSKIKYYTKQG